jgi:hypothetical protein
VSASVSVLEIHQEMDRVRVEFHGLLAQASPNDLARASDGTHWSNEQLLFHMLFGYLVVRNLRIIVEVFGRLPDPVSRAFGRLLDSLNRPFHVINYLGSRRGARVIRPARIGRRFDRTIASLQRHLDAETESALARRMHFPTRWDPFFGDVMTLQDVYHYPTQHFDFHRAQLTLNQKD